MAENFNINEASKNTRNELILAGIRELHERGITDFSIRRVAASCGVSCAAPYRHFKNKEDFIDSIIGYINRKWYLEQNMIPSSYSNTRERLVEISVEYVRFLVENPDYYTIIMLNTDSGSVVSGMNISICTRGLIKNYCNETSMSDEDRVRKTFVVRSLIFGAAAMILSGELPNTEESFDMVRSLVEREFELD